MHDILSTPIVLGLGIAGLYLLMRLVRRHSITYLPGPKSESWLVGNIPSFVRPQNAGEADFDWSRKYGLAFRTKGCFGENILYLADPKGIQYVLNKSGYNFPKTYESRIRQQLTTGRGIVWAEGTEHSRQRKIMNPAFSYSALKEFLPLFFDISRKNTAIWKAKLHDQGKKTSTFNVSPWLAKMTLDVIGAAAFGYKFNALEGDQTELFKAYYNLFPDAHYMIPNSTIIFRRLTGYAPFWLTKHIHLLPRKDMRRMKRCADLNYNLGRELVAQEMEAQEQGKAGGKDLMSIFVRANLSEDPKRRLTEDEVLSQIRTLTFAGHETTANTLNWIIYELSKHPDVQHKVRDEIRTSRAKANTREDKELSIADLESMKYTMAVIKETLRFHPIVFQVYRRAGRDDVIPLERPQRTISGEMVNAIPVSKGQAVTVSFCVYNRLESVWGKDADQWRPERFLEDLPKEHGINLGVSGNLATFSSGVRSCIGWRFSLLETEAILIELIENFHFSPAPGNVEIRRAMAIIIEPMVKGQEHLGAQMPLTVTAVDEM